MQDVFHLIKEKPLNEINMFLDALQRSNQLEKRTKSILNNQNHSQKQMTIGYTPLLWAVKCGAFETVKYLVHIGSDISAIGPNQMNALHIATEHDSSAIMEFLLEKGIPVDSQCDHHIQAIHIAAREGLMDNVKILLKHGANINAESDFKMTPLHYAVKNNRLEIVRYLLANGANNFPDANGNTPQILALKLGYDHLVSLFFHDGVSESSEISQDIYQKPPEMSDDKNKQKLKKKIEKSPNKHRKHQNQEEEIDNFSFDNPMLFEEGPVPKKSKTRFRKRSKPSESSNKQLILKISNPKVDEIAKFSSSEVSSYALNSVVYSSDYYSSDSYSSEYENNKNNKKINKSPKRKTQQNIKKTVKKKKVSKARKNKKTISKKTKNEEYSESNKKEEKPKEKKDKKPSESEESSEKNTSSSVDELHSIPYETKINYSGKDYEEIYVDSSSDGKLNSNLVPQFKISNSHQKSSEEETEKEEPIINISQSPKSEEVIEEVIEFATDSLHLYDTSMTMTPKPNEEKEDEKENEIIESNENISNSNESSSENHEKEQSESSGYEIKSESNDENAKIKTKTPKKIIRKANTKRKSIIHQENNEKENGTIDSEEEEKFTPSIQNEEKDKINLDSENDTSTKSELERENDDAESNQIKENEEKTKKEDLDHKNAPNQNEKDSDKEINEQINSEHSSNESDSQNSKSESQNESKTKSLSESSSNESLSDKKEKITTKSSSKKSNDQTKKKKKFVKQQKKNKQKQVKTSEKKEEGKIYEPIVFIRRKKPTRRPSLFKHGASNKENILTVVEENIDVKENNQKSENEEENKKIPPLSARSLTDEEPKTLTYDSDDHPQTYDPTKRRKKRKIKRRRTRVSSDSHENILPLQQLSDLITPFNFFPGEDNNTPTHTLSSDDETKENPENKENNSEEKEIPKLTIIIQQSPEVSPVKQENKVDEIDDEEIQLEQKERLPTLTQGTKILSPTGKIKHIRRRSTASYTPPSSIDETQGLVLQDTKLNDLIDEKPKGRMQSFVVAETPPGEKSNTLQIQEVLCTKNGSNTPWG